MKCFFRYRYKLIVAFIGATLSASAVAQSANQTICKPSGITEQVNSDVKRLGHGQLAAPRNALRPQNLKWELPIAVTTAVLIGEVDRPAANRIRSVSFEQLVSRWSNIGLGAELGSGALAYGVGCFAHSPYAASTGLTTLEAMGAASTITLALKLAFDRQFPYSPNSTGQFWGGGRSFPSGHTATSFAFATVIAHRYPHKRYLKWSAYALATGVSLSRYPAKRHFPSDILIGGTLGYLVGTYVVKHAADASISRRWDLER